MALDVPADDWRWTVAGWPHARWKAWHDRVTEAAPWGSTVEEIERARWEAFQAVLIHGEEGHPGRARSGARAFLQYIRGPAMAWITRGPYGYQYRTIRRGGKVIRQYEAALPAADVPLLRQLQAVWRSRREVARLDWEDERRRLAEEESRVAGLDRAYDELATAALLAAGFHRPKRDRWRRRRAMANRIEAKVEDRPPLATREQMIELLDAIDRAEGEARRELGESVCEVLRFLVECARDGDERALPPLRVALECRPAYFGRVGIADFATKAMAISGAGSKDVFARELFIKEIEAVRDEVAGPNPTALERLLAERVALSWFDSHQREIAGLEAMTRGCGLDEAEYHSRQRTRASARFLAATRAIATVKRLAMPVLHIHKDETPPAPVAPERLRVLTDRPG